MVKIGLLVSQDGPSGIWAVSSEACATLAVHELNASGGILGQEVHLTLIDAGTTARSAGEAAADAVAVEAVDAVVAMLPSFARGVVAGRIAHRVPFVYTPQFECCALEPGVMAVGETSNELLKPGIAFLVEAKRARRFFLVGNDYVWPRKTFQAAKPIIRDAGGLVVGEVYLPFGFSDYDAVFGAVRRSGADVVLPYILGGDAIGFNRAFAQSGLASHVLRFSSAIDETILYGIGDGATENLFLSSAYFANLCSRNNGGFLERYHGLFGETPPPANEFGQSCYEGIHCLAGLVEAAGVLRARDVQKCVRQVAQRRTARGFESVSLAGGSRPIHLASVDGCEVKIMTAC